MPNIRIVILHVELEKDVPNLNEFVAQHAQSMDGVKNVEVVHHFPTHFEVHPSGGKSLVSDDFRDLETTSFCP